MLDNETLALARKVNERLFIARKIMVTAESCTGGLIASAVTSVPGSSSILFGGYVTYDNRAKIEMIGVPDDLIDQYGAVSEQVAIAMAEGARSTSRTDLAIAVTGVAGPGGGSADKPVGLVHFALTTGETTMHREHRFGALGRDEIRQETVRFALKMIIDAGND
ncbi:CinA family protein [Pelagibacterium lentulum]